MRRQRQESFGLSPENLRTLRALKTPARIQQFIDALEYQYANTAWSPQRVLRERKGHCLEGALLAAAALRVQSYPPLLMDLEAVQDDDHVVAVYREGGLWGGIAKSNFAGLRFRAPIYRTLRELALSYFEHYYNLRGERTLRAYSRPVNLARLDSRHWMTSEEDVLVRPGVAHRSEALPAFSRQSGAHAAPPRPPQLRGGNAWLGEALTRDAGGVVLTNSGQRGPGWSAAWNSSKRRCGFAGVEWSWFASNPRPARPQTAVQCEQTGAEPGDSCACRH